MTYQPLQDYGIIGDMHSAALVGTDGSIDWLCSPHFDSPSVFATILDDEKGGRFKIAPAAQGAARKQLYWPDTNVLITRFFSPDGVGEIIDYMPVGIPENGHGYHQVIRRARVVRGEMGFRMECSPAFDYALNSTRPRSRTKARASAPLA
jgi:GH15 family glucan-1,4-alpha-glucosidase